MRRIDSSAIGHLGYQDQRRLLYVTYRASRGSYMSMSACHGAAATPC
jgi:hypothetical protein